MAKKRTKNLDEKIVEVVLAQAFSGSLCSVSTKRIAQRLHVSEATIFAHFPSKKSLLQKTFQAAWRVFPEGLSFPADISLPAEKTAFRVYADKVRFALRKPMAASYIAQYFLSRNYSPSADRIYEEPFRSLARERLLRVYPERDPAELEFLLDRYFECTAFSLNAFVLGQYPHDDATIFFFWRSLLQGFLTLSFTPADSSFSLTDFLSPQ